jgi:nucleoside-diphosphate kinase
METPDVERTLVLFKPDAVQRGLVGPILSRFEQKGLKIVGLKLRQFSTEHMERHYDVHKERPFFADLVKFMTSAPVIALALEGKNAIEVVRGMMGATDGGKAAPGTIRGDYGMSFSRNLVHGSDGPESAETELALFFPETGEVAPWTPVTEEWSYSVAEEL